MSLYSILLHAHSGFRWLILLVGVVVVIKSLIGLFANSQYGKFDNIISASFIGFMHLQLLIGIVLYFVSPIVQSALSAGMGNMMADSNLRFWGMEHGVTMIIAIALAQVGRSKSKKLSAPLKKFKTQLIFFTLSLALMLWAIPWERVAA